MILENNIDVLIDSEIGCFEISHSEGLKIYYEFVFYPEILN
jgi:hypothetical protein